jgi:hypothetical protein
MSARTQRRRRVRQIPDQRQAPAGSDKNNQNILQWIGGGLMLAGSVASVAMDM